MKGKSNKKGQTVEDKIFEKFIKYNKYSIRLGKKMFPLFKQFGDFNKYPFDDKELKYLGIKITKKKEEPNITGSVQKLSEWI